MRGSKNNATGDETRYEWRQASPGAALPAPQSQVNDEVLARLSRIEALLEKLLAR